MGNLFEEFGYLCDWLEAKLKNNLTANEDSVLRSLQRDFHNILAREASYATLQMGLITLVKILNYFWRSMNPEMKDDKKPSTVLLIDDIDAPLFTVFLSTQLDSDGQPDRILGFYMALIYCLTNYAGRESYRKLIACGVLNPFGIGNLIYSGRDSEIYTRLRKKNNPYLDHFAFSKDEVKELLGHYKVGEAKTRLCEEWFNRYQTEMYTPPSIVNFLTRVSEEQEDGTYNEDISSWQPRLKTPFEILPEQLFNYASVIRFLNAILYDKGTELLKTREYKLDALKTAFNREQFDALKDVVDNRYSEKPKEPFKEFYIRFLYHFGYLDAVNDQGEFDLMYVNLERRKFLLDRTISFAENRLRYFGPMDQISIDLIKCTKAKIDRDNWKLDGKATKKVVKSISALIWKMGLGMKNFNPQTDPELMELNKIMKCIKPENHEYQAIHQTEYVLQHHFTLYLIELRDANIFATEWASNFETAKPPSFTFPNGASEKKDKDKLLRLQQSLDGLYIDVVNRIAYIFEYKDNGDVDKAFFQCIFYILYFYNIDFIGELMLSRIVCVGLNFLSRKDETKKDEDLCQIKTFAFEEDNDESVKALIAICEMSKFIAWINEEKDANKKAVMEEFREGILEMLRKKLE